MTAARAYLVRQIVLTSSDSLHEIEKTIRHILRVSPGVSCNAFSSMSYKKFRIKCLRFFNGISSSLTVYLPHGLRLSLKDGSVEIWNNDARVISECPVPEKRKFEKMSENNNTPVSI